MKHLLYTAITFGIGLALIGACSSRNEDKDETAPAPAEDSLPTTIRILTEAVTDGDAKRFASLVSYPLTRPYPLHDIENENAMVAYYAVLVDDSLRNVITAARDSDWYDSGWRGWSLGDGDYLWVDEKLYDVPYLSEREKSRRTDLEQREMESLPKKYRKGWHPLACMRSVSNGAVYRLDHNPSAHPGQAYRMMMWDGESLLRLEPKKVFIGRCHTEGTANVHTYFLAASTGAKAVYMADINSAEERPRILFTDSIGNNHTDTVAAAYWLDLLPPAR